jgi:hypothetical protein
MVWIGRVQGGASTATDALLCAAKEMSAAQRDLYGKRLVAYAKHVEAPEAGALHPSVAADRLIEIIEQQSAPSRIAVGADAEEMLSATRHLSDEQLDAMRLEPASAG